MAEIRAFEGLRYRDGIDLFSVTCPPYDVLSPEQRTELQDRSPYAAARLILPSGEGDSRYANAADLLADWIRDGVLQAETSAAVYVTRIEFSEPGSDGSVRRSRLGLTALVKLHEYADGVVLPHERTLSGPKEDRLKLLRETEANVESILGLVDDPKGSIYAELAAIVKAIPTSEFDGDDGLRHSLFVVTDRAIIERLAALLADEPIFIADGHHRYETSVTYAKELGVLGTEAPEAFLMASLSTFSDPGLSVLPTHRLVRGTSPDFRTSLFRHLHRYFDVRENVDQADLEGRLRLHIGNQAVFGLTMPSGALYQLTARDLTELQDALPDSVEPALRNLEVVLLQYLILEPALGIAATDVATTDRLAYTRDVSEAIARVHSGEFDLGLLLSRPSVTAVREVSLAGEVMPQKSTFFYPKLLSGLVMRKF